MGRVMTQIKCERIDCENNGEDGRCMAPVISLQEVRDKSGNFSMHCSEYQKAWDMYDGGLDGKSFMRQIKRSRGSRYGVQKDK